MNNLQQNGTRQKNIFNVMKIQIAMPNMLMVLEIWADLYSTNFKSICDHDFKEADAPYRRLKFHVRTFSLAEKQTIPPSYNSAAHLSNRKETFFLCQLTCARDLLSVLFLAGHLFLSSCFFQDVINFHIPFCVSLKTPTLDEGQFG